MRTHSASRKPVIFTGMACALMLAGCALISRNAGTDRSNLTVHNECDVSLTQHHLTGGSTDGDVIEDVSVQPDCTTLIKFRQLTGDSLVDIEGGEVMYGGQERTPAPATVPVETPPAVEQPAPVVVEPDPGGEDQ